MQMVGQNQYDSVHEFNIHWPYGFNIRILGWNYNLDKNQVGQYPSKQL